MNEKLREHLNNIPCGVNTPWGETAWPAKSMPYIRDLALANEWIILGGDVLTLECKHTYDNWYYSVDPQTSLADNVKCSIEKCRQYIDHYIYTNGEDFLFTISMSDAYIDGRIGI